MARTPKGINSQVINKAVKGTRIKNEKELVAFLNAYGVAKQLKFLATIMLPPQRKFKLRFSVGDDSYTDMKNEIVIGIPKSVIGRTKEEIFADAKWRLIHEVGHLLYTDNNAWTKFIDDFAQYMNTKHSIGEGIGKKVAQNILNCLEDGREENVMRNENPGNDKYIQYGRSQWYLENEIKEVEAGTEIARELFDTLFNLASLSTTGHYAYKYADVYQQRPELLDMVRGWKPLINQFINYIDPNPIYGLPEALPVAWTLIYSMENWLVDLMKQIPEPDLNDLLNNFQQSAGANGSVGGGQGSSYGSSGNTSTPQQGGGGQGSQGQNGGTGASPRTGVNQNMSGGDPNAQGNDPGAGGANGADPNDPNNPNGANGQSQTAGSNSADGDGGRISRINDSDDSEYDTDMNEIVEEAMRDAMKNVVDDEFDSVQQADFDDMLHQDREEKENEDADPEVEQAVRDYYSNMDYSKRGGEDWAADLRIETYNYDPKEASTAVKMEARMLNQEFQKIFLNKADIDSHNKRRGLLNTNDLYKMKTRDFNIFMKKGNPRNTDYVFYILVDGSGSMSGDKFTEALRACSILEESLRGIAPVKIVMFDYDGDVRHRVIKGFKELNHGNMSWTFANRQRSGSCNMDGFSIRVATKELQKRSERRKILFTLSDGQPNGPYNYSGDRGENDVTEAVMEARKNGISVFNIFFAHSRKEREEDLPSFCHMYRNKGIISCAPSEISRELLRVVKRELNA